MIQYDLKDLRLFVLIARLRSFRLAAEHSFMTVSAASVRIRKLEENFKTSLFIRHPRDVELTEAGERFLKDAQVILSQAENLETNMERFSGRQDNTVRLYCTYSALTGRLKKDIGDFLLRYPQVKLDFTLMRSQEIVEALLEGVADIGVFGYSEKSIEGLHFSPYFTCKFVLLLQRSTASQLHIRRRVSLKELKDVPFIALTKGTSLQTYLEEHSKNEGVRLNIRARFPSMHAGLEALRTLGAVMIVPSYSSLTRELDLMTVEIDEPWVKQDIKICVPNEHRRIRPETRDLMTFLLLAVNGDGM